MGGHDICCIKGCQQRREPATEAQANNKFSFYKVPTQPPNRVACWLQAIRQSQIRKSWKVCGAHFVGGKPSNREQDVDYIPTLMLYATGSAPGCLSSGSGKTNRTVDEISGKTSHDGDDDVKENPTELSRDDGEYSGDDGSVNKALTDRGPNGELLCSTCGKSFRFRSKLRAHVLRHEGRHQSNTVTCLDCGKTLSSKATLKVHVKEVHERRKNFVCDHCGQKFAGSTGLKYHVANHTGERPYSCGHCGEGFSRKSSLWNHELRKHGETSREKLACHICGMTFLMNSRLTTHMDKHKKESYSCAICGKMFSHKSNLQTHVKGIHEQSDRYRCTYCSRRFGNSYNLKVHVRIHTGEKPFHCHACNRNFSDVCNFRRHELRCKPSDGAGRHGYSQSEAANHGARPCGYSQSEETNHGADHHGHSQSEEANHGSDHCGYSQSEKANPGAGHHGYSQSEEANHGACVRAEWGVPEDRTRVHGVCPVEGSDRVGHSMGSGMCTATGGGVVCDGTRVPGVYTVGGGGIVCDETRVPGEGCDMICDGTRVTGVCTEEGGPVTNVGGVSEAGVATGVAVVCNETRGLGVCRVEGSDIVRMRALYSDHVTLGSAVTGAPSIQSGSMNAMLELL